MRIILLSGGSGKRLWPVSNEARPKQFMKVIRGEDGEFYSMLQNVWNQLNRLNLADQTVIATNKQHAQIIYNQLDSAVTIVEEPYIWDTFAAIALSTSYLIEKQSADLNETVVVLPVDSFADDDFYSVIAKLDKVLEDEKVNLALIGIRPTEPSEQYGYIIPKTVPDASKVDRFVEKPPLELAEDLITQGALWNCGVFAFRLGFMAALMKQREIPIAYEQLRECYTSLPKRSFDYEVVEKEPDIAVVAYEGRWTDLGTWTELTKQMLRTVHGLGSLSEDSDNTYIVNELNIPIVVMGVPDVIVAASSEGILICNKENQPTFKEMIASLTGHTEHSKLEERPFGWSRILDYSKDDHGEEVITRKIHVRAGQILKEEYQKNRLKTWKIVRGDGRIRLNGEGLTLRLGDVIEIHPGSFHGLKALDDLDLIEIQSGFNLLEDDSDPLAAASSDQTVGWRDKHEI